MSDESKAIDGFSGAIVDHAEQYKGTVMSEPTNKEIGSPEWYRSKPWQRKFILAELAEAEKYIAVLLGYKRLSEEQQETINRVTALPDKWRKQDDHLPQPISAEEASRLCAYQLDAALQGEN